MEEYYATGRRKSAVARVYLRPGKGNIKVNGREAKVYFQRDILLKVIQQPLERVSLVGKFDILVNVRGGGLTGQAGAVKHGISRALLEYNPELRLTLKKAGYLTRDPRVKERKKYGLKGARARFQYSKR